MKSVTEACMKVKEEDVLEEMLHEIEIFLDNEYRSNEECLCSDAKECILSLGGHKIMIDDMGKIKEKKQEREVHNAFEKLIVVC